MRHILAATASTVIGVALMPHLVAFAVRLLALCVFTKTTSGRHYHGGHHLVFHSDAVNATITQ